MGCQLKKIMGGQIHKEISNFVYFKKFEKDTIKLEWLRKTAAEKKFKAEKVYYWMGSCMGGWIGGWVYVKAVLRIA